MDRQGNGAESLARKLLFLGNQMVAIAGDLQGPCNPANARIRQSIQFMGGRGGKVNSEAGGIPEWNVGEFWTDMAEGMYAERRMRERFFPTGLFEEPAWDFLLDLYIAENKNKKVLTTSACIGANVAPTTGLRYLDKLEALGLVERMSDLEDARRTIVRISSKAFSALSAYLAESWSRRQQDQQGSRVVRKAGPHHVSQEAVTQRKSAFFEEYEVEVT